MQIKPRRSSRLTIALPSSVISLSENLLVQSLRLAMIARAAAIFRVEQILIYLERDSSVDRRLQGIARVILDYLATPQYLRKKIFKKSNVLKYVGVLPPLRSPSHVVPNDIAEVKAGDFREGIIIRSGKRLKVDVGLDGLFDLVGDRSDSDNSRTIVKVIDPGRRLAEVASWDDVPYYWCYRVESPRYTLTQVLRSGQRSFKIATSRLGKPIGQSLHDIRTFLRNRQDVLIAFGSPNRGLLDILAREGTDLGSFDLIVNTAMNQGVATIRTEEAIMISLAVMNDLIP